MPHAVQENSLNLHSIICDIMSARKWRETEQNINIGNLHTLKMSQVYNFLINN